MTAPAICPECRDGKGANCNGIALCPRTDDFVACQGHVRKEASNA